MVDLNADVGTIVKELLGGKKQGKGASSSPASRAQSANPMRKVMILAACALLATAAYVKFFYLPRQEALKAEIEKLQETIKLKNELVQFEREERELSKKLNKNREKYKAAVQEYSPLGKLDPLYQIISDIAAEHGLVVAFIETTAKAEVRTLKEVVTEKSVDVQLQGKFQDYTGFRRELAQKRKLLSVKHEVIQMNPDNPGQIGIVLTLLDYSIDKQALEEVLREKK